MKINLIDFFVKFKKRGGYHIFISTLLSQFIQMIITIVVVRMLTPTEYGEITFIQSFVSLFIPFSGMGLNYSLLRFGSIAETSSKSRSIYKICLKYGLIASAVLYIVVCLLGFVLNFSLISNYIYLYIFSLMLISTFLQETAQSYLRVLGKNVSFANNNILFSMLLFVISIVGTYFFGMIGFIIARVTVPIIIFCIIVMKEKLYKREVIQEDVELTQYVNYGFFVGLGSVASQLMYQIDTLLLGVLGISSFLIAEYKIATVIPFAILFIPSAIMTTDFVLISKKYNDREFLNNYRNKVMIVLLVISLLGVLISLLFSEKIILLLYGKQYIGASKVMNVLMVGIVASFALRSPNGNILAAVGKSNWNAFLAYSTVIFNIILNYIFINLYGVIGAAVATTIVMWGTGIISYLMCNKYIADLK